MSKILVSGGLVPTTKDTLLDARTRVATFADIANIENPARFMVITVEDTGKKYEVRKLSSKIIGGIVVESSTIDIADPEALVDLGLAEELRSEDEKIRQSNESKRIEAENLRKSAEDIRKVNETNRASAEGAREASERTRVSSEETRNANEQTRNSNETKRQSQESTRQSQESARQNNESVRNTNESARKEAESERKTEETSRRTAELSRSSAENTRVKNEQNRTTAENTRSSAEDRRVTYEAQRATNETARNNAELSREQAEGNRASTFNTLKGQMQTTIQEGKAAVAATEKATSDAQKVVDNYDTKVAEQDSKLTELGSQILPLTGIITVNFTGKDTQHSEKSFQLIAGRTYNFIAKRKEASSFPVYINIFRKEDDGSIKGFTIDADSLEGESPSLYTPSIDVEAYVRYYTGDINTECDVCVIDSQSDFERLQTDASYLWDSVETLAPTANTYVYLTGDIYSTTKNLTSYVLDGVHIKRIKAYLGGLNTQALAIAFYRGNELNADNYISGITAVINSKQWIEAAVPSDCVKIGITNFEDNLPATEVKVLIVYKNDTKAVLELQEKIKSQADTLKAFDPQQTLICSNYLYTNTGEEAALTRIYYLTESDNETIREASITGMIINALGTGTLSTYIANNVELDNRVETLVEDISISMLGVQVVRFSKPIVVGIGQTLGFKLGFKHAISTTYNPVGFVGVRYLNNNVLTLSNKDFGFGLIGMKKYNEQDKFPIIRGNLGSFLNRINPYYDHLFIDKISGVDVIIPSESIYSVAISKRLGFDMLELNVKGTSDGQFVVMHGDNGKFGEQFEHIDGKTNISSTLINSVTLEWIKTNVRYKSIYPKYRTAPSTLEEMLHECKSCGIIPFVQRTDVKVNNAWVYSTDIADKIMGKDNYVSYGGGTKRITSAPIYYFGGENTLSEILAVVEKYGNPFIYALNNVTKFTDEELTEIVDTLHTKGCFVAFVGCYQREPLNQKLLRMGFDMTASGWNVPNFIDSNIVCADDFSQFIHNGTISDNVLLLTQGDVISIENQGNTPFLSVGLLQLRFSGTIRIKMGNYIDDDFTSDGNNAITLTTYYMEAAPIFNIEAKSDTAITEILFKASKR